MNEYTMKEDREWLWFSSVPGLTYPQQTSLLQYFGSPHEILTALEEALDQWCRLDRGWMRNVIRCRDTWEEMTDKTQEYMSVRHIRFVRRDDPLFPGKLKMIPDCPYGIFTMGKLPDEKKKSIAIVGARACSSYGLRFAAQLGERLAAYGVEIISGMASGIDGAAQSHALSCGGYSAAVLGCGVDLCYPAEHQQLYRDLISNGCIISEYPLQSPPVSFRFPQRNRIISGLSDIVIVIEARKRSGSLITADYALEQGKDIYAVPGRSGDALSAGCNSLIRQGAGIIVSVEDFLAECGLCEYEEETDTDEKYPVKLDRNEQMVWEQLDSRPLSLSQIAQRTGLSLHETAAAILKLQLLDRAVEIGKNYYIEA